MSKIVYPFDVCVKRYYRGYLYEEEGLSEDQLETSAKKMIVAEQDKALSPDPDLEIEESDIEWVQMDKEGTWTEEEDHEIEEILRKGDIPMEQMSIARIAYELYKQKWLHDHTIWSERLQVSREYWVDVVEQQRRGIKPKSFQAWMEKGNGFKGEMYASFEEFSSNEYLDVPSMMQLLKSDTLVLLYRQDRAILLRGKIHRILSESIADDYLAPIMDDCIEEIVEDVKASTDYLKTGTYNDADIKLAIGRVLLKRLRLEA